MDTDDLKRCSRCQVRQPRATAFHKKACLPDGLQGQCKTCTLEQRRAYVLANPEKIKAQSADWYRRNRERDLARRKAYAVARKQRNEAQR